MCWACWYYRHFRTLIINPSIQLQWWQYARRYPDDDATCHDRATWSSLLNNWGGVRLKGVRRRPLWFDDRSDGFFFELGSDLMDWSTSGSTELSSYEDIYEVHVVRIWLWRNLARSKSRTVVLSYCRLRSASEERPTKTSLIRRSQRRFIN